MAETRVIGHAQHQPRGPHFDLSADFAPLQLFLEADDLHIEVTCAEAIVGRHTEADLRFGCADVSRRHCRLAFESGLWRVHDLRSLNGTYLNNQPTLEATLFTGDMLRVGSITLLVKAGTPLRLSKAQEQKHDKLRQIVDLLPPENAA